MYGDGKTQSYCQQPPKPRSHRAAPGVPGAPSLGVGPEGETKANEYAQGEAIDDAMVQELLGEDMNMDMDMERNGSKGPVQVCKEEDTYLD